MQLHGATLSEYVRAKRIPRGLRIQKPPTLGRTNENFCAKWCEILNKASLDLTVLVIQYTQSELSATQELIDEIQNTISNTVNPDTLTTIEQDVKSTVAKYKETTQLTKLKKFKRDTMNYKNNRVYPWLTYSPSTARQKKRVHFNDQPSYTSGSSSEYQSDSDGSFLGLDDHASGSQPRYNMRQRQDEANGVPKGQLRQQQKKQHKKKI